MAERLTLTTPIVSSTTVNDIQITSILTERLPTRRFVIKWRDWGGFNLWYA